jgi:hypothetical protein
VATAGALRALGAWDGIRNPGLEEIERSIKHGIKGAGAAATNSCMQLPAQPCAALLPLLTGLGKTTTTSSSDLLWTWTGRLLCCLLPLPPPPKKSTYPPARERPAAARRESIPVLIVKPTTTPLSSWSLLSTVAVPSGGGAELQCSSSSIACGVVKIGPCMVTRTPVHEDATVPGKPVRFYYER